MSIFAELSFKSADGRLRLHGRDYGPRSAPLTILCMGGLTRGLLDFVDLTETFPQYRFLAIDQRGRGRSEWDPEVENYTPVVQMGDMFSLLDELAIDRVVLLGTSNGGLMAMLMAATQAPRVAGLILNDIGPSIPVEALIRIRESLSDRGVVKDWAEAAEQARRINAVALPDYTEQDWHGFARRTYLEDASGTPVVAYDPAITLPLAAMTEGMELPDLWPVWDTLGKTPTLIVRGTHSDVLTPGIFEEMLARHGDAESVVVPDRGHCPMLDEPAAVAALTGFLAQLEHTPARTEGAPTTSSAKA